jgi:hypothetical protein
VKRIVIVIITASFAIAAVCMVGMAFSYTGSTDNNGNITSSEYVLLDQSTYNFQNDQNYTIKVHTLVVRDNDGNGKAMYCISETSSLDALCKLGGTMYNGKLIGQDTISANNSLADPQDPKTFYVNIYNDAGFADLSDSDWRYILQFTAAGKDTQYAISDGQNDWTYVKCVSNDPLTFESETHLEFCDNVDHYTSKLYLAGPGFTINDKRIIGTPLYLSGDPKENDLTTYLTAGRLIYNGTISYEYDSTWTNAIV